MREAVRPVLGRDPTTAELYDRFGPADHEIVAGFVPASEAAGAVRRLMAAYRRGLDRMPPYPGVEALLAGLAERGFRLALCTGRGRPSTDLLLAEIDFGARFETTVTGEEAARPKPAPDGLFETARRLGLAPEVLLYVGDSVKDVEAGLAAGALTVAAAWGGVEGRPAGFARAALVADRPGDILDFLDTRTAR
jgi:HAD superfamily hydrolase (TIGR01509 family)